MMALDGSSLAGLAISAGGDGGSGGERGGVGLGTDEVEARLWATSGRAKHATGNG